MKKLINGLLAGLFAAGLFLGSALVARADDDQKMDDHGGSWGQGMGDGMGMMGGKHWDMMKEKMGLTDDQVAKLKALFKSHMEEMKTVWDQLKIDMDTLQQKVDTKASDSEIKKLLDALSADRDKLEAGRKKLENACKEILTPTQQAKFVLKMRQWGHGMMQNWGKNWKKGDWKNKKDKDGDEKKEKGGVDSSN